MVNNKKPLNNIKKLISENLIEVINYGKIRGYYTKIFEG